MRGVGGDGKIFGHAPDLSNQTYSRIRRSGLLFGLNIGHKGIDDPLRHSRVFLFVRR